MKGKHFEIRQMATGLSVGETLNNQKCPFCSGGINNDKAFSITREDQGLLYICYRDKCRASGFVATNPALISSYEPGFKSRKKEFQPKKFDKPLRRLNDEELQIFRSRFEVSPERLSSEGVKRIDDGTGRIWWPVRSVEGYEIGGIARFWPWMAGVSRWRGPKAVAYREVDKVWGHFVAHSQREKTDRLILVEDQVSAAKVAEFYDSCALLGTDLSLEMATEISKYYSHIVMMLDPDACYTALKHQKRYSLLFGNFEVKLLSKSDPKDMPYEQLEQLLTKQY